VFPTYEYLLHKLEMAKSDLDRYPERQHLAVHINAGWRKLREYYTIIDQTPVYYASTALHPAFRWDFFRCKWGEHADLWLPEAKRVVKDLWLSKYASLPIVPQQTQGSPVDEMSGDFEDDFEQFLIGNRPATEGFDDDIEEMDEYERWQMDRSPFDHEHTVKDVVEYWIGKGEQYRRLPRMALNLFVFPAMSAVQLRSVLFLWSFVDNPSPEWVGHAYEFHPDTSLLVSC